MKKILHISKYHTNHSGGIENIANIINTELSEKFDIKTIAFSSNKENGKRDFKTILCTPFITIMSQPISFKYIAEIIKQSGNHDIIYLHYPNILAIFALLFVKNKNIIIHWHSDIVNKSLLYSFVKWIEKRMLEKAKIVILSSANYSKSSKTLECVQSKVKVINYGIKDLTYNNKERKRSIKEKNDRRTILSIGRLVPYKGFSYLINAMKYLDKNKFELIIIGRGSLKKSLQKVINDNHLLNVKILSEIKDCEKNKLLNSSHIFCLPSITRAEAFGLALVEALSFGLPLVTFDMPSSGTNFINQDNLTGYTVKMKDSKDLAKKIEAIAFNKIKYERFSGNSRKRYLQFFTEPIFVAKMCEVFSTVSEVDKFK